MSSMVSDAPRHIHDASLDHVLFIEIDKIDFGKLAHQFDPVRLKTIGPISEYCANCANR